MYLESVGGKMTKYKIKYIFPGGAENLDDEIYDTYEEADDAANYGCSCYTLGGEILHLSNPGDYDNPQESDSPTYEIIKAEGDE